MNTNVGSAPNGKSVLLDSMVLIDHLNGTRTATEFLLRLEKNNLGAVSAITRAEVLTGCGVDTEAVVEEILDRYQFLPVGKRVAVAAARLRRRYRWALPDAMQAATAQVHGLLLATRNTRDFPPDRHHFVIVPYAV